MKRAMILIVALLAVLGVAVAYAVEAPNKCKICNMDRNMFDYSRMLVEYKDGTTLGTCSLHCVVDYQMENPSKKIKTIQVADLNTKELIDARTAIWVIGGKKKGVMTGEPKWAFADEKNAKTFIKTNGGKIITFNDAWKMSEEESKRMKEK